VRHENETDEVSQRSGQLADEQDKAERKDEAEDRHLCIVAWTGGVPLVKEFDQRREKRSQQEHQSSELEEASHRPSIPSWTFMSPLCIEPYSVAFIGASMATAETNGS
jgi:hypothetical protein